MSAEIASLLKEAERIANAAMMKELIADIDFNGDLDALLKGMEVEKEHGPSGPDGGKFDITGGDPKLTAEIAAAHLAESPNYYDELQKMEESMESDEDEDAGHSSGEEDGDESGNTSNASGGDVKKQISDFIKENPSLKDSDFHSFVSGLGMDESAGEEIVYSLAHDLLNKVKTKSEEKLAKLIGSL